MVTGTKRLPFILLAAFFVALLASAAALADPVITGMSIIRGPLQSRAIIYGTDFGDFQGQSYVLLGNRIIPVLAWSNAAINIYVNPLAYNQGPIALDTVYPVQVVKPAAGKKSNTFNFLLTSEPPPPFVPPTPVPAPSDQPAFEGLNKDRFCPGDFLAFHGSGFGAVQGLSYVTVTVPFKDAHGNLIHQEYGMPVLNWSESDVTVSLVLPPGAQLNTTYTVTVHRGNGKTSTATFTVIDCGGPAAPAITLVPSSLNFGKQDVGSTSGPLLAVLTNIGTGPLTISGVSLTGADAAQFSIVQGGSAGAVDPGNSRTIAVQFSPAAAATYNATLSISTNAAGSPHLVTLTGTGVPPPAPVATFTATSLSFGNQKVGTTSAAQSVTLTNTGNAPLHVTSITLTGANKAEFAFTAGGSAVTLAPNASQTISVDFTPAATGSRTAAITLADDAPGNPHAITLSGAGTAPAVTLNPTSLDFGSQATGTTSAAKSFTLTNTGNAPLNLTSVTLTGANKAEFAFTAGNTGGTLAAGASQTVSLTFTPAATGTRAAAVSIVDDATGSPQTVALTGNGTAPSAPAVMLAPTGLDFGSQRVGTTSAAQSFTLTNNGTAALHVTSVAVTGANAGDFSFTGGNTVSMLPAGASQVISLTFTPSATGSRSAAVTITDDAPGSPHTVTLTGTGTAPAVTLHPTSLDFGSQVVGATSAAQSFTITNSGTAVLNLTSITLTGANKAEFAFTAGNTGGTLAAGASQTVSLTFTPSATGTRAAAVSIVDDATGSPQSVALTGVGNTVPAPAVSLNPTTLDFGKQLVNTTSAGLSVVLTNTGNAALHITAVTPGGANASEFAITAGSGAGTLAAGASRTITATFTPGATGARNATISIASDAAGSPHVVTLTGTGTQPGISVTPTSLDFGKQRVGVKSAAQNITVTNNGTAPLTISGVTPGGTNSGDFTATGGPGVLAAGGSVIIPVTFTPGSTGARSATLTIASDAPGSAPVVTLTGTGVASGIGINPTSLGFGQQLVGTPSAAQSVTLTNNGTAPLNITSVTPAGANAGDFAVTAGSGASVVAVGGTLTISVTFDPAAPGNRAATLAIVSDAPGSPTVTLTGVGIQPAVSFSPTALNFGSQPVGTTTAPLTLTVTNTGTAPLSVNNISITGGNQGDFVLGGLQLCLGVGTIAPGAACQMQFQFSPSGLGSRSSTLMVFTDAPGSPHSIPLIGNGTASTGMPALDVSPSGLDFGSQPVGTDSAFQTVTITNTGNAPLTIFSIVENGVSDDFPSFTDCNGSTLAAGGTCSFQVRFHPNASGQRDSSLFLIDSAPGSPHPIPLTGVGVSGVPLPKLTISPSSFNFGSLPVGTQDQDVTFTLQNTGSAPLMIYDIYIDGADPNDFSFTQAAFGHTLEPGATAPIFAHFNPTQGGKLSATIFVDDNAPGSPHPITVTGTGLTNVPTPKLTISPTSLNFGDQEVGVQSAAQTVTVTNTGTLPATIFGTFHPHSGLGDYFWNSSCDGSTLAPGDTCTLDVSFIPSTTGVRTDTIFVASDAFGSPQTIAITGNGVTLPGISISPDHLDLGDRTVNSQSAPQTVTITNTGAAPLIINDISIQGDFSFVGACPTGTPIPPGGSCTVDVSFLPQDVSYRFGFLTIDTNLPVNPHYVSLIGFGNTDGLAPTMTLSATSLNFGSQKVGTDSQNKTITFTNTGTVPLQIYGIAAIGPNAGEFPGNQSCTPAPIPPGGTCDLTVHFHPLATGTQTEQVQIDSNAVGGPVFATLTGQGT